MTERGLWLEGLQRLQRNRAASGAGAVLLFMLLLAFAGPALSPHDAEALDWENIAVAPQFSTTGHWLGTDRLGRDLFVRTLQATQISLLIGLLATAVSLLIGISWGALAGYIGGRTDELMMRAVDVLYSLPYLFIVIILTTVFARGNVYVLFMAIGAVGWLTMARIVRGQALSLKQKEFVAAAVVAGVGTPGILAQHIVPNLLGPVIVYATLAIPQMILYESFLSFLGLGVQEPLASLGSLINQGARDIESAPWILLVPAGFLVTLLVCFNFVGDGLRDAFDPRER